MGDDVMPENISDPQLSVEQLQGAALWDAEGKQLGTVQHIYADVTTGHPEFVTVAVVPDSPNHAAVPTLQLRETVDGYQTSLSRDEIMDGPGLRVNEELSTEHEQVLYEYYGFPHPMASKDLAGPRKAGVDGGLAAEVVDRKGDDHSTVIPGVRRSEGQAQPTVNQLRRVT